MGKKLICIPFFIILISCFNNPNKIKVASLFSDGMVLQRNNKVDIWGTSTPNLNIRIQTEWGQDLVIKSDDVGNWTAKIKTLDAGGPFYLKIISNKENIIIKDVLIGEVWLASGQSNMEMTLKGYPPNDTILNFEKEIAIADYPFIRMFNVDKQFSMNPKNEFKGSWLEASPSQVDQFSATAYFFARKIHEELDVPIGIIHSSWGGSPCESWTSKDKLNELGLFKKFLNEMSDAKSNNVVTKWFESFNSVNIPQQIDIGDRLENEFKNLDFSDEEVTKPKYDDTGWEEVFLPGRFDTLVSSNFDGVMWFRKHFYVDNIDTDYYLIIGFIDDMDKTYINGKYIGGLNGLGYWNKKRQYKIPASYLKKGNNIVTIRAIDTGGPGRFEGDMKISNDLGINIPLEGKWKYLTIAEIYEDKIYIYNSNFSIADRPVFIKHNPFMPAALFNSMIYPLIPYTIKGAIWYQGESNVGRHDEYSKLFPGMIKDWRSRWQSNFPFYFVQIAPYKYTEDIDNHQSQLLRDSQRKVLNQPNTGMVVTLDIGDFKNIHPANKQEVGHRLARLALVNEYGSNFNPLGPILTSNSTKKSFVELKYEHVGSELKLKENSINEFEIAAADMKFFEANTSVDSNRLILFSKHVNVPKYVRYAWSDTPHATLFNGDNFPASSFYLELK